MTTDYEIALRSLDRMIAHVTELADKAAAHKHEFSAGAHFAYKAAAEAIERERDHVASMQATADALSQTLAALRQ